MVNLLFLMYFSWGNIIDVCKVFKEVDEMVYNEIIYNVMINGLVSLERGVEALMMF